MSESRPRLGRGAEIMQREQKYTQGSDFVFHIVHEDLYLTQILAGKVFTPREIISPNIPYGFMVEVEHHQP